jgi:cytochrome b subunit of formate dehydrogenase
MKIDRLLHYFICLLLDLSLGYLVIFLFLLHKELHKEDVTWLTKQVKINFYQNYWIDPNFDKRK